MDHRLNRHLRYRYIGYRGIDISGDPRIKFIRKRLLAVSGEVALKGRAREYLAAVKGIN